MFGMKFLAVKYAKNNTITPAHTKLFRGRSLTSFPGVWGNPANCLKRSAKGELKNSPVDCFLRRNALQGRAFPY